MKNWNWNVAVNTEVDVDVDVTLDDVLDFLDNCPKEYRQVIKKAVIEPTDGQLCESLEDELKFKVFLEKTKHMSLDELEKRLS